MENSINSNGKLGLTSAVTAAGASIGTTADVAEAKQIVLRGGKLENSAARIQTEAENASLLLGLRNVVEGRAQELIRKASRKQNDPVGSIIDILRMASISTKGSEFGDPKVIEEFQQTIQKCESEPLILAMVMGGGKVANLLKTGLSFLPDLSEWHALSMLEAVALAISEFRKAGCSILVIPDAALHTADLGFSIEESLIHQRMLRADLKLLGLRHVQVPEILSFLENSDWPRTVRSLSISVRKQEKVDQVFKKHVEDQIGSLVYSINTRVADMNFEEAVLVYAAIANQHDDLSGPLRKQADELMGRARAIVHHYIAVNFAIRQTGLVEKVVKTLTGSSRLLRMSVHAKRGEPRPALFTPSSQFPNLMGLLPMHSLGVCLRGNKVRYGAAFELAARLRCWTRVVDDSGRFLYYENPESAERLEFAGLPCPLPQAGADMQTH
jgi:hypothetical protein